MLLIHMAVRRQRCVVGTSAWAWTFTSADGGGGERKGSTLGKRSSSQSSAPRWCSQPRHRAAHGEQLRNSSKVDKLPLDLGETLPSAADAKCQHHRLLFLSFREANRGCREKWAMQKQTVVAGKRVKPRESSWGEETSQTHIPVQHLDYRVLPVCACIGLVVLFFKSGFSCNQNPVIEEVERDLKLQRPCKNSLMLKHGICQTKFAFSVALGAFGEFVGGLRPAHKINGSGCCPGAVLGWMDFLRQRWCAKAWGRVL